MLPKVKKVCLAFISVGSFFILFLPLFVYKNVMYPYIFSKMIVFQILVEIIFVAWLFLAIYDKRYRPNFKNPLILTLTIFLSILILTAAVGVDFSRSFWSTQERMTGILAFVHFYLWFLVLSSTLKKWEDWRKLIFISLLCSFSVGLYGLAQRLGLDFVLRPNYPQMSATLGNPIYLAVYSMLHLFLTVFLFLKEKKPFRRGVALGFVFFNLGIIFLTASRMVIMASITSFLILGGYLLFNLSRYWIKFIFIPIFILLILALIGGLIFLQTQKGKPWIYQTPLLMYRFVYLSENIENRIIPWQAGWQGFLERPISGWGWENFHIIFNKYLKPKVYRWGEENSWFDKSHNQIIDVLSLTGIVGLISYLLIWIAIFYLLFKEIKKEQESQSRLSLIALTLLFLSYFLQNLTVFDTPGPLIIFYFSVAMIYFITQPQINISPEKSQTLPKKFQTDPKLKIQNSKQFSQSILILFFLIILPIMIYNFNLKPLYASQTAVKGFRLSQIDLKAGLEFYQKSLSVNTFINPEVRSLLIESFVKNQNKVQDEKTKREMIKFILFELEKNIQEHPRDVRYWIQLGQFYISAGMTEGKKEWLDKAEMAFEGAKKLSPQRQQVYFGLINTNLLKNDLETALNLAKEVVQLDPEVGDSRKALGVVYLRQGKFSEAINELEEADKKIDLYSDPLLILSWSNAYYQIDNLKRAIEIVEKAKGLHPNYVEIYTHLAVLYQKVGEKKKALEMVNKAVELKPSLKEEAEQFLQLLK
ncbi:MAG: O-antigen ligase family protein [Patescibacteria group bacterium]|nr:O-antigen ligase family protein [Patescibacteria group bacterium]